MKITTKHIITRTLFILVAFIINSFNLYSQTATQPGGNGTVDAPFVISSLENLYWISQNSEHWDKYYIQSHNIDASDTKNWNAGKGWQPIGNINKFSGFYDGQSHAISGLYINRPDENNIGLFGHIGHVTSTTEATEVKNLGLKNVDIVGGRGTGSLIGRVTGNENTIIESCYVVSGFIKGDGATGGLIGSHNSFQETPGGVNNPVLLNSFANVDVLINSDAEGDKDKFGGLIGCTQKGTILNSYAKGSVTVTGGTRIGGLAGCADFRGEVNNCYASTIINVTDCSNVGGLVGNTEGSGANTGKVENSFWDIEVSGILTSAGGTGVSGKTSEEMKDENTYSGWLFGEIWGIDLNINYGYPYILAGDEPLSISLIEFSAFVQNNMIIVEWITASETNNDYFLVEKTLDFEHFETIALIKGNGTSKEINQYKVDDLNPYNGMSYYRLTQVDFDGKKENFPYKPVVFKNQVENKALVFPNPSIGGNFNIIIDSSYGNLVKLTIFDITGRIKSQNSINIPEGKQLSINASDINILLESGLYIVNVVGERNKRSEKFIVK